MRFSYDTNYRDAHALLRYLPPWATDHTLVNCRIIIGEAAAAAGAGAVGISGEAAAAAGAEAVGKRKRSPTDSEQTD
jgi:hypothetical protein